MKSSKTLSYCLAALCCLHMCVAAAAEDINSILSRSDQIMGGVIAGKRVDQELHTDFWQSMNVSGNKEREAFVRGLLSDTLLKPLEYMRLAVFSARESFRQGKVVRLPALDDRYREMELTYKEYGISLSRLETLKGFAEQLLEAAASRKPFALPDGRKEILQELHLDGMLIVFDRRIREARKLIAPEWRDEKVTAKLYDKVKVTVSLPYEFLALEQKTTLCDVPTAMHMIVSEVYRGGMILAVQPFLGCLGAMGDSQSTVNLLLYGAMRADGIISDSSTRVTAKWRNYYSSKSCGSRAGSRHFCMRIVLMDDRGRVYQFAGMSLDSQDQADVLLKELEGSVEIID